ncbi:NUDIX domain-containing protein [uncultured Brachyspira sp.]|uniref:NUDIX hydrolase n=1 Tax=uncultured Brachyspira sp. TaxID=221953 RepID=UPI0025883BAB|nr:NUDIX domain-containing protein [uncultured Brachyspira sp.]
MVVETPKGIVFVERKFEPKKGYIDLPGGFCEPYERIEDAVRRELFEETNIKIDNIHFLISGTNEYVYEGMMYVTTDMFFYAKIDYVPDVKPSDDASEVVFIKKENIDFDRLAFKSSKEALIEYIKITQ